jgi:hypothetical protein
MSSADNQSRADKFVDTFESSLVPFNTQNPIPINVTSLTFNFTQTNYISAWDIAEKRYNEIEPHLNVKIERNFTIALIMYTDNIYNIYIPFNEAVRESYKNGDLNSMNNDNKLLYYWIDNAFNTSLYQTDETVYRGVTFEVEINAQTYYRFNQFASSSRLKSKAEEYIDPKNNPNGTLIEIQCCVKGIYLKQLSFNPSEEEVLIHPHEYFSVINYSKIPNGLSYNYLKLKSNSILLYHNSIGILSITLIVGLFQKFQNNIL